MSVCVCLSVCLSVCPSASEMSSPNFLGMLVMAARDLVLLWSDRNILKHGIKHDLYANSKNMNSFISVKMQENCKQTNMRKWRYQRIFM